MKSCEPKKAAAFAAAFFGSQEIALQCSYETKALRAKDAQLRARNKSCAFKILSTRVYEAHFCSGFDK